MTVHRVKSWPEFFEPMATGNMTCSLRRNDRRYKVGDFLHVMEWMPNNSPFADRRAGFGKLTGRELTFEITHVLEGVGGGAIEPMQGLHHRFAILSLKPQPKIAPVEDRKELEKEPAA